MIWEHQKLKRRQPQDEHTVPVIWKTDQQEEQATTAQYQSNDARQEGSEVWALSRQDKVKGSIPFDYHFFYWYPLTGVVNTITVCTKNVHISAGE